jgi:hypothetical protein
MCEHRSQQEERLMSYFTRVSGEAFDADQIEQLCDCGHSHYACECEDEVRCRGCDEPLGDSLYCVGCEEVSLAPVIHLADASKVTPRQFIDALGLSSPEEREARRAADREGCMRAIRRGDTFGWPGVLVDQCRAIIAERDGAELAPVEHLGPGKVAA